MKNIEVDFYNDLDDLEVVFYSDSFEEEDFDLLNQNTDYKNNGRALKRRNDWKKANRKVRILKENYSIIDIRPTHYYCKNKIHCSCPHCSEKKKNGFTSISEQKKIDKMQSELIELFFNNREEE